MKKIFAVMAFLFIAITLTACGGEEVKEGTFDVADGKYFAVNDEFSHGYKYWTVVTVENKRITDVEWNGYHRDGGVVDCQGTDKKTCSESGLYGMDTKDPNNTKGKWITQAQAVENWIIDNQDINPEFNDDGVLVDAMSSATIHSTELFDLVEEALESTKVAEGDYEDGYYYLTTDTTKTKDYQYGRELEDGTLIDVVSETGPNYTFAVFVVVNGTIVYTDINATQNLYDFVLNQDGSFKMTTVLDENGDPVKTTNYAGDEVDLKVKTILVEPKKDSDGNVIADTYVAVTEYLTKDPAGLMYGMKKSGSDYEWNEQMAIIEEYILNNQGITSSDPDDYAGVSMSGTMAGVVSIFTAFEAEAE